MREPAVGLILLSSVFCAPAALAASAATIEALQAPVSIQRGGSETALSSGAEIRLDDRLSTGGAGRLALRIEPGARLQLDVDSEIELVVGSGNQDSPPAVTVRRGRVCVQYSPGAGTPRQFELRFGEAVTVIVFEQGQVCGDFTDGLSRIVLAEGTVQIANRIEPGMVILSEAGSEYRFDDSGFFELGKTDARMSIEVSNDVAAAPAFDSAGEDSSPPSAASEDPDDPPQAASSAASQESTETGETTASDAAVGAATIDSTASAYVYTVYLFSTLSPETADEVNQRLRDAGHRTEILTSEGGESIRYRVAASGFTSRQAAQDFSARVVGKHGIRDSWIGRSKATP